MRNRRVESVKRQPSVTVAYSVTHGAYTSLAAAEANDFESADLEIAPVRFVSLQTGQNVKSCKKARSLVHSRFDSIDASLMFAKQHMGGTACLGLG